MSPKRTTQMIILAAALFAWTGGPAWSQSSHEAIKQRLVYIEARKIPKDRPCNEQIFVEGPHIKGTGILLTNQLVLTAFHVAMKGVEEGMIRCYAIFRNTEKQTLRIGRPIVAAGDERPNFAGENVDLALIRLRDPIGDGSLQSCPTIATKVPAESESLFAIGYKGADANRQTAVGIPDPKTYEFKLLSRCAPPALCAVDRGVPGGISGSPVVDVQDRLIGVIKGGDSLETGFDSLLNGLLQLEPHCHRQLSADNALYCQTQKRQELERKRPFEPVTKRVTCERQGKSADDLPGAHYAAPDGFAISGFVTHDDVADADKNGWVGHAEYGLSDNGLYVKDVTVALGCNSAKAGFAQTTIRGSIKKILKKEDEEQIKAAASCSAVRSGDVR